MAEKRDDRKQLIHIRLDKDIYNALTEEAELSGATLSNTVNSALRLFYYDSQLNQVERNQMIMTDMLNALIRHVMDASDQKEYLPIYDHPTRIYRDAKTSLSEYILRQQYKKREY